MLQKGAPIMPFSVAVMMSVGICGRGGRCGAENMVEGLEDGGGGGEADVRRWDERLCAVVVVGAFDGEDRPRYVIHVHTIASGINVLATPPPLLETTS